MTNPNMSSIAAAEAVLIAILLFLPIVRSTFIIPPDNALLDTWFNNEVGLFSTRKIALHTLVAAAERLPKVIIVKADGTGQFKTITDAIKSIPENNDKRVIVYIAPGHYFEKVKIQRLKPFITLFGDPLDMPSLMFDGTNAEFETSNSGTLIVEADYFSAVNLNIVNTASKPNDMRKNAQAVAMDISGDCASFYKCQFRGYENTLMDDLGRHFFKDCYIEGTKDFIFGGGTSLYLNTEINVIPGDLNPVITAQSRDNSKATSGFVFAHCNITGSTGNLTSSNGHAFLGRSWYDYSRVIFAFCEMGDVIDPRGWTDNKEPKTDGLVYFGEFDNRGPGAKLDGRVPFLKRMNEADCEKFVSLNFIQAATWLLPAASPVLPKAR